MALKEYEVLVPVKGEMAVVVEAASAEDAVRQVVEEQIDWREWAEPSVDWEIDGPGAVEATVLD